RALSARSPSLYFLDPRRPRPTRPTLRTCTQFRLPHGPSVRPFLARALRPAVRGLLSKGARGPSTRAKFSGNPSLRDALLSGMLGGPALRDELGEAAQGPAGLELADDVHEVGVGVDSEQQTVVD